MAFLYLDIVTMQFESFLFSGSLGENIETILKGPSDIEKQNFSVIYKCSLFGIVITLSYLTYLSLIDVFIDIFYCHEMKRKPLFDDYTNFNLNKHEKNTQNSSSISDQTAIYNEINCMENNRNIIDMEIVTLNGIVSPLRIRWLRYMISDSSGLKCVKFMRLPGEDEEYGDEDWANEYGEAGNMNEMILGGLESDLELAMRNGRGFQGQRVVVVPRVLPKRKENEKIKYKCMNSFFILSLYIFTLLIYQFLDTALKLSLMYLIMQIPYWPWNLLITITIQTIILGMCFTFQNSPMTNYIIGFLVNIFGIIPLLLASQYRIKHNVKISLSLLSLRSMEFLFFILLIIVLPYNTNLQELYLLSTDLSEMNDNRVVSIYDTLLKKLFIVLVVLYFIHQIMLFIVLRIIIILPPQNEESGNTSQRNNLDNNNNNNSISEPISSSTYLFNYYRQN
ncbi:hypothetical protein RS030_162459 [Cryptosporidium xiaoi]|uniref:Uncharacterized protein n=1 Tax=Cryptosporidium xiaoi TaxID=659607 RepID=A0AAV9Y0E3_9CRYT